MTERIQTLIDADRIASRVQELGRQISEDFRGSELVLLCILKGSFIFAADLARAIDLPVMIEFMGVSSYGAATKSSGVVQITQDVSRPLAGKQVLIVEDIVDTGLTLDYLRQQIEARQAAKVSVCALLHKPAREKVRVTIDYLGFTIEDRFVVGYGLDWDQKFRNLPFIGEVVSS